MWEGVHLETCKSCLPSADIIDKLQLSQDTQNIKSSTQFSKTSQKQMYGSSSASSGDKLRSKRYSRDTLLIKTEMY